MATMTRDQACARLHMSHALLDSLIRTGQLHVSPACGGVVIETDDVERLATQSAEARAELAVRFATREYAGEQIIEQLADEL